MGSGSTVTLVIDMENQIITGDCVAVMASLPPSMIDLIVTSPPYPGQLGNTMPVPEWLQWFDDVMRQMVRVLSPVGVIALNVMFKRTEDGWFDGRLLTDVPTLMKAHGLNFIDLYPWTKPNPAPNGPLQYCDIPAYEFVFAYTKARHVKGYHFEPYRLPYRDKSKASNGRLCTTRKDNAFLHPAGARQTNVISISSSGDQGRPRADGGSFPIDLPLRFIRQFSAVGDWVLDPFSGVGTTAKAAQQLGRRWLGIEIDPHEVELSRRWLAEPYQMSLEKI